MVIHWRILFVYRWWRIGNVNAFSIEEFFSSNGNANVPSHSSKMWQAVIWTSGYFIWKERNTRVFKGQVSSLNKIVEDIKLKSYEWIVRRSGKKSSINWQQWLFDPVKCRVWSWMVSCKYEEVEFIAVGTAQLQLQACTPLFGFVGMFWCCVSIWLYMVSSIQSFGSMLLNILWWAMSGWRK